MKTFILVISFLICISIGAIIGKNIPCQNFSPVYQLQIIDSTGVLYDDARKVGEFKLKGELRTIIEKDNE